MLINAWVLTSYTNNLGGNLCINIKLHNLKGWVNNIRRTTISSGYGYGFQTVLSEF